MSMDESDRDVYGHCVGCEGRVWLNHTGSFLAVEPYCGGGWLHTTCRAAYEAEHGPVVCEEDDQETADAKMAERVARGLDT